MKKALFFLGRLPATSFDFVQTFYLGKRRQTTSGLMISFDDGPSPLSTPYILQELRAIRNREGLPVKAGFFLIGKDKLGSRRFDIWSGRRQVRRASSNRMRNHLWRAPSAENHPEIVRAIQEAGHCVLVHSQHHKDLAACSLQEIETEVIGCHETLVAAGAKPARYFRPPYLSMPAIPPDSRLIKEGWKIISGISSGDAHPWATEESVVECCIRRIKRGQGRVVLIFHDFRSLPAHRLDIGKIIEGLTRAGYSMEDFDPEVLAVPLMPQRLRSAIRK